MALKSWLPIPDDHEFSIENLPFGIFSTRLNVGYLFHSRSITVLPNMRYNSLCLALE
jgi:hypothetical protein